MITDFTEYHREYYRKRRQKIIDYLGGRCIECGATENLHVDHIDPMQKSFHISRNVTLNNPAVRAELDKCQLLCRPHHEAKTAKENSGWSHGTMTGWQKKKCRCGECRAAQLDYNEKRKAGRRKPGGRGPYNVKPKAA